MAGRTLKDSHGALLIMITHCPVLKLESAGRSPAVSNYSAGLAACPAKGAVSEPVIGWVGAPRAARGRCFPPGAPDTSRPMCHLLGHVTSSKVSLYHPPPGEEGFFFFRRVRGRGKRKTHKLRFFLFSLELNIIRRVV